MSDKIDHGRRKLLKTTAGAAAATGIITHATVPDVTGKKGTALSGYSG